jgi:hypothetical protein
MIVANKAGLQWLFSVQIGAQVDGPLTHFTRA